MKMINLLYLLLTGVLITNLFAGTPSLTLMIVSFIIVFIVVLLEDKVRNIDNE